MNIKPIRNDDDHREGVEEIRALWSAQPGTEEFVRLDVLATLVDSYERKRWPIEKLDPVEAIKRAAPAQSLPASARSPWA